MTNKLTSIKGFGEGDPKPDGAKSKALASKGGKKEVVGYGKSFSSEKDHDAYKKYMGEKRARAKARKTPEDAERTSIRKHFASEAKHFGM